MNSQEPLNISPVWRHLSTSESTYVIVWKARSAGGELFCSSVIQFDNIDDVSCAVVLMPQGTIVMAEVASDIKRGMALCDRYVDQQMTAAPSRFSALIFSHSMS